MGHRILAYGILEGAFEFGLGEDLAVVDGSKAEGVGDPVEQVEHRDHVNGLGDLRFGPACLAKAVDVGIGHLVRGERQPAGEGQQGAFGVGDGSTVQVASSQGGDDVAARVFVLKETGVG